MLCLLIPQKRQVKDLNVYLVHLIDGQHELWRALDVIHATKPRGLQAFKVYMDLSMDYS